MAKSIDVLDNLGVFLITGAQNPSLLQQVMLPIVSMTVCNGPGYYPGSITARMICAGLEQGGRDSCTVSNMMMMRITLFQDLYKGDMYTSTVVIFIKSIYNSVI